MTERSNIHRIAAETFHDARTIGRVLRGEHVRPATRKAIEAAARKLHIALPPAGRGNGTPSTPSTPPEAA